ncbi:DUF309 domain-containing protein [Bacillus gaemokensis]|uniref:DUF309 domain-containing protein n=1 Tax=Bacillus gaemokensis TaxID=574375 RepID=A0A073KRZ0_9BACI|nr:DUF309 domain-containing protein [Bacillus gaemokensis]KEK25153.1 hypothetical protein BAGA_10955 [Bacillus gaemokensis]KYG37404.1 hypothetical protein AZF08_08350 [Bacillus gaemokensis]
MEEYPFAYYEFFVKYNEGDYYTCHDLLEEMWLEDRSNLFLKELLQMAVAQYHYSYGNVKGARLMMEVAEQYLTPYCPMYWDLDVKQVVMFIQRCRKVIPEKIEKVSYEEVHTLPPLPVLFLYMK